MSRYVIIFKSGRSIDADDARYGGAGHLIEYIERDTRAMRAIHASEVKEIRVEEHGLEGGKRFTGKHDVSFALTPGSICAWDKENIR